MADPIRSFRHFRDVPDQLWRWSNFSPAEIACRGTGQLKLHPAALDTLQALRDHGLAAAIGVWFSLIAGLAAAVTRKAFTNEALLHKLEQELEAERLRIEKRRDEDRRVDHDRLERIERDIHDMRNLMFAAFQRKSDD